MSATIVGVMVEIEVDGKPCASLILFVDGTCNLMGAPPPAAGDRELFIFRTPPAFFEEALEHLPQRWFPTNGQPIAAYGAKGRITAKVGLQLDSKEERFAVFGSDDLAFAPPDMEGWIRSLFATARSLKDGAFSPGEGGAAS